MRSHCLAFTALLALFCGPLWAAAPAQVDVYVSGTDGYHTYRIPAVLTTAEGTVLAFCEGRKGGRGDAGDIDMLLKRSTDHGRTWSAAQVIWDDGANTCGNPCVVQDRTTGTLWLAMTHNLGHDRESAIWAGTSEGTRSVWICRSADDGKTWSKPRDITGSAKLPNWSWYATGPGVGIQLARGEHKGRLVIPCDHGVLGGRDYHSHVFYSDDHGETWKLGGSTPDKTSSECQVAELGDGALLLDIRTHFARTFRRKFSYSRDGGDTWSEVEQKDELIGPHCQASLLGHARGPGADPLLLFSNPAATEGRRNMTVRLSRDEGKTWPIGKTIHAGPSAYSCLTVLPDGRVGCLYERGVEHAYEKITLATMTLDWLTASKE